jgi:putative membrane protein
MNTTERDASELPATKAVEEIVVPPNGPPNGPPNTAEERPRPVGLGSVLSARALAGDLVNVGRGFCMGAADTVPGVSGGTVALILGHYQRLVTAVSRVDVTLLRLVVRRRFVTAAQYLDLRFLIALAVGLMAGVVLLAGAMHWLLENRLPEIFAVFFGLVLASAVIVARRIDRWSPSRWWGLAIGVVVAAGISFLPASGESGSPVFLFAAGAIAICAMILPGISGAFVLLLLGAYHPVTGLIRGLSHGDVSFPSLLTLIVFSLGCLTGLLCFAKLLRWLLEHHRGTTMASLLGLMIGSVARIWPLQVPTSDTAALEMKFRQYVFVAPGNWEGSLTLLAALAVVSAAVVLAAEFMAERLSEDASR